MTSFNLKKWQIALLFVFAFLIFTNPSIKRLKEYVGTNSYKGLKRDKNFFLFSVYKVDVIEDEQVVGEKKYVGAFLNFFENAPKPVTVKVRTQYEPVNDRVNLNNENKKMTVDEAIEEFERTHK